MGDAVRAPLVHRPSTARSEALDSEQGRSSPSDYSHFPPFFFRVVPYFYLPPHTQYATLTKMATRVPSHDPWHLL